MINSHGVQMFPAQTSPFALIADPSSALAAAQRLAQTLPKRTYSLEMRKGNAVDDEVARFDEKIEASSKGT